MGPSARARRMATMGAVGTRTMDESVHLGTIAGIRIGANWSLLVIFWLIVWALSGTELPLVARGYGTAAYWVAGVATALAFYACLLAHELAHAVVARRAGIEVHGIVLWLLGGVSRLEGEASGPDTELRIAVAGPATSIVIAVGFLGLSRLVDVVSGAALLTAALGWLGWINGVLGVFNLAPAFPLDGGRVLRAVLWRRHGDKVRATQTAAHAGRVFGYCLIALGLLELAGGAGVGGLWLVFLGWFLLAAARGEATASLLGGLRVRDVMTPDPVVAPAWLTVSQLLDDWISPNRCSSFPLIDQRGALVGLVTLARVKRVPPDLRPSVQVGEVACPRAEVVTCGPDDELVAMVQRLAASEDQRALVLEGELEGERVVGIVSPSDVTRATEHAQLARH